MFRVLANAADLHIRIRECEAYQQTHKRLAEYSTPDGLNIDHAAQQQDLEVCAHLLERQSRWFNPLPKGRLTVNYGPYCL